MSLEACPLMQSRIKYPVKYIGLMFKLVHSQIPNSRCRVLVWSGSQTAEGAKGIGRKEDRKQVGEYEVHKGVYIGANTLYIWIEGSGD
jgi:hypothetical protein